MWDLRQTWRAYRNSKGAKHETVTVLLALVVGLGLMPLLIWLVGDRTLGPYTGGGPMALWRDYLSGVFHGSSPYLAVAAGPYVAVWLWRAVRRALQQ